MGSGHFCRHREDVVCVCVRKREERGRERGNDNECACENWEGIRSQRSSSSVAWPMEEKSVKMQKDV